MLIPLLSVSAGEEVASDAVFDSVQTTSWLELPVLGSPEAGSCASVVALELKKYSVPLFAPLNELTPRDCGGHTVNPGCVEPASLGAFTRPKVSR